MTDDLKERVMAIFHPPVLYVYALNRWSWDRAKLGAQNLVQVFHMGDMAPNIQPTTYCNSTSASAGSWN